MTITACFRARPFCSPGSVGRRSPSGFALPWPSAGRGPWLGLPQSTCPSGARGGGAMRGVRRSCCLEKNPLGNLSGGGRVWKRSRPASFRSVALLWCFPMAGRVTTAVCPGRASRSGSASGRRSERWWRCSFASKNATGLRVGVGRSALAWGEQSLEPQRSPVLGARRRAAEKRQKNGVSPVLVTRRGAGRLAERWARPFWFTGASG